MRHIPLPHHSQTTLEGTPAMPGFKGTAEHSIDSKGRVPVPSDMRPFIDAKARGTFVATRGAEPCIVLYPVTVWEEEVEPRLMELNRHSRKAALLVRSFTMHAKESTMDGQSRITLPKNLMELVGLEPGGKAQMVGVMDRIEVWSSENLMAHIEKSRAVLADLEEELMTPAPSVTSRRVVGTRLAR